MRRSSYAVSMIALMIATSGCDQVETASNRGGTVTVTRTWSAHDIREVRITEVNGSVTVQPAKTAVVSLVATARGNFTTRKDAENEGLFETRLEDESLRIGRRDGSKRRGSWNIPIVFGRQRRQIDYVLEVPPSTSLQIRTVNGRITTRGIDGPTEVVSVNGPIEVETTGRHELTARTVNGRVRATFSESFQGARFKTVNGRVRATLPESASFAVDLSQVNGDFEASFPLSIRSSPGSRRVSGDVNGGHYPLRIVTVNGDVELARLVDSR